MAIRRWVYWMQACGEPAIMPADSPDQHPAQAFGWSVVEGESEEQILAIAKVFTHERGLLGDAFVPLTLTDDRVIYPDEGLGVLLEAIRVGWTRGSMAEALIGGAVASGMVWLYRRALDALFGCRTIKLTLEGVTPSSVEECWGEYTSSDGMGTRTAHSVWIEMGKVTLELDEEVSAKITIDLGTKKLDVEGDTVPQMIKFEVHCPALLGSKKDFEYKPSPSDTEDDRKRYRDIFRFLTWVVSTCGQRTDRPDLFSLRRPWRLSEVEPRSSTD